MPTIKRKTIAFNIDDPYQKELYDHVCKYKNFSFYGKSLIQKDISGDWGMSKDSIENDSELELSLDIAESFI